MTELLASAAITTVHKSAIEVSSSLRLRYSVTRIVQRRVTFHVPFWPLFMWLRNFPIERLKDPYVQSTEFLARELENSFREHRHWKNSDPTRSQALSVVHEVHLAFCAIGKDDPAVSVQLESLHGDFRAEVLKHLRNTDEPAIRLERADWATLQDHEAQIRRMNRLRPFDVNVDQLTKFFEALRSTSPSVTAGNFYLLEGSYGSGKSEQAEAWLSQQVERYRLIDRAPVPVHFDASRLEMVSLEDRIKSEVGLTSVQTRGVALVVDGLDEIHSERASRILDDASALVMKYPKSKVLLTSRVGVLDGHLLLNERNHHAQAPLDADTALSLIETVAGTKPYTAMQNPAFEESVKLPFFALAAAVAHREGKTKPSRAGLIRTLVETALGRPSSIRNSIGTTAIMSRLEQLAVHGMRRGSGDGMSTVDRWMLLETGLVRRSGENDQICFSLPLLEQWCAAQSLRSEPDLLNEAINSSKAFENWRWALAIALDESEWTTYNKIIMRCMTQDLGAWAWLVRESSRRILHMEKAQDDSVEQATRLKQAIDHVVRTAPLYTELIFPVPDEKHRLVFDVKANRGLISIDWYSKPQSETDDPRDTSLAIQRWGVSPSDEKTWPWDYLKNRLAAGVDQRFWQHLDLGWPGGLWEHERRFSLAAQLLAPGRGPRPPSIRLEELRDRLHKVLQYIDLETLGSFESGGVKASGAAFRDLVNWAHTFPGTEFQPLVPSSMADPRTTNSADDLFPSRLVHRHLLEAHGFGAAICDQAASELFSAFKWRWREADGAARGVIGVTHDSRTYRTALDRIVTRIAVPAHLLKDIEKEFGATFDHSSNGRASFLHFTEDRAEDLREAAFSVLDRDRPRGNGGPPQVWSSGVLHTSHDRPASIVAHGLLRHSFWAVGLDSALSNARRFR